MLRCAMFIMTYCKQLRLIHLMWIAAVANPFLFISTLVQGATSEHGNASVDKSPSPTPISFFTEEDITKGSFYSMSDVIPLDVCPALDISYSLIMPVDVGAMRVPHSTIRMNGHKCGPLPDNATMQELWTENYMELTPITYLTSKKVAQQYGVLGIYNRIFTRRTFTQALYKTIVNAIDANLTRPMVYVGLERHTSRTCGYGSSTIILPYNTFVFIGMFDTITDFAAFTPYDENVPLRAMTPFHISFTEGDPSSPTEPEISCPYYRPTPTPTPRAPNIRMCVPASAILTTVQGDFLPVNQARVGDVVLGKSKTPSPIIAFSHRDERGVARYISMRVRGSNGENLSLDVSAGHYIFVVDKNSGNGDTSFRSAGDVSLGDVVLTNQGSGYVDSLEEVWLNGIYNVHTSSGSVIVNGIVISCYTTAVPPITAHSLLTPVRFFMPFSLLNVSTSVNHLIFQNICAVISKLKAFAYYHNSQAYKGRFASPC